MPVLTRIMMLIVAYLLACMAAALVLTVGTLTPQWGDLLQTGVETATIGSVIVVGAAVIAGIAMLPSLLVIALAEGFALRSSILYAVLGGALALSLSYGIDFAGYMGGSDPGLAHERQVLAAAGIAGGFVYWLFAGRKAGSWRR